MTAAILLLVQFYSRAQLLTLVACCCSYLIPQSLKIITEKCSLRIAKYAFEYAYMNGRKKVSAVHKANIMKQADGLFLECCRKVSKEYPTIKFEEIIVDNCCMQMVSNPSQFDVMGAQTQ